MSRATHNRFKQASAASKDSAVPTMTNGGAS